MKKQQKFQKLQITKFLTFLFLFIGTISFAQNSGQWKPVGLMQWPVNYQDEYAQIGRVDRIVQHPKDSNTIYALTPSTGLWKSTDKGVSWASLTDSFAIGPVSSLAFDPINPDTMYLGTGDIDFTERWVGIFKSIDGGKSWSRLTKTASPWNNTVVSSIEVAPYDNKRIVAATIDGVYLSIDGGIKWKKTLSTYSYRMSKKHNLSTCKTLYMVSDSAFYTSIDFGGSWKALDLKKNNIVDKNGKLNRYITFAIGRDDTTKIYIMGCDDATRSFSGIYYSNNSGKSFVKFSPKKNLFGYDENGALSGGQIPYTFTMAIHPDSANVIYVGAVDLYKSVDTGKTFNLLRFWYKTANHNSMHADKHDISFSKFKDNSMFIAHDGGVSVSSIGNHDWQYVSNGLPLTMYYNFATSHTNPKVWSGGTQDNSANAFNNGTYYIYSGGDDYGDYQYDYKKPNLMYHISDVYDNNIVSRNSIGLTGSNQVISRASSETYAAYSQNNTSLPDISITKDLSNGSSASFIIIKDSLKTDAVTGLAFSYKNSNILYYSRDNNHIFICKNANTSLPQGVQLLNKFNYKTTYGNINCLETSPVGDSILYVGCYQKMLRSNDSGKTYKDITPSTLKLNGSITKIIADYTAKDESIYIFVDNKIYYWNNKIKIWKLFMDGLPKYFLYADADIYSDSIGTGVLRLATYGYGVWESPLYGKIKLNKENVDFSFYPANNPCNGYVTVNDQTRGAYTSTKWDIYPSSGFSYVDCTDTSSTLKLKFTNNGLYYFKMRKIQGMDTIILLKSFISKQSPQKGLCFSKNTISTGTGLTDFTMGNNFLITPNGGGKHFENLDLTCQNGLLLPLDKKIPFENHFALKGTLEVGVWIATPTITSKYTWTNVYKKKLPGISNKDSIMINSLFTFKDTLTRLRIASDNKITAPCSPFTSGSAYDFSVYLDGTAPKIKLSNGIKSNGTKVIKIRTSEPIIDIQKTFFKVYGLNLGRVNQISWLDYEMEYSFSKQGILTISLDSNLYKDIAGNFNKDTSFLKINNGLYIDSATAKNETRPANNDSIKKLITLYLNDSEDLSNVVARFKSINGNLTCQSKSIVGFNPFDLSDTISILITSLDGKLTNSYKIIVEKDCKNYVWIGGEDITNFDNYNKSNNWCKGKSTLMPPNSLDNVFILNKNKFWPQVAKKSFANDLYISKNANLYIIDTLQIFGNAEIQGKINFSTSGIIELADSSNSQKFPKNGISNLLVNRGEKSLQGNTYFKDGKIIFDYSSKKSKTRGLINTYLDTLFMGTNSSLFETVNNYVNGYTQYLFPVKKTVPLNYSNANISILSTHNLGDTFVITRKKGTSDLKIDTIIGDWNYLIKSFSTQYEIKELNNKSLSNFKVELKVDDITTQNYCFLYKTKYDIYWKRKENDIKDTVNELITGTFPGDSLPVIIMATPYTPIGGIENDKSSKDDIKILSINKMISLEINSVPINEFNYSFMVNNIDGKELFKGKYGAKFDMNPFPKGIYQITVYKKEKPILTKKLTF